MSTAPNNTWDRLLRAMRQTDPNNPDGLWALAISGSVNLAGGGGAGGTSMVDDNPFTPGGTSITPAGGYVGGRQVASGNAGAFGMSPSGAMLVHVIAGGAGGGLAQLQVVGTNNSDFNNVGWPSGAAVATLNTVPVMVVNQAAAGGGFASAAVYGSPAFPVYAVGSFNVVNPVGILGVAGSVQITGSVNPHGVFAPAGSVNVVGSVGATQLGAPWSFVGSMGATNLGGSVGVTQIGAPWSVTGSQGVTQLGAPWSMVGSVGVTPLAAFSLGGVPVVDTRGSLVPTQWLISASGGTALVASVVTGGRLYFYGVKLLTDATVNVAFQSPSGVYLEGTQQLLPGAGFAENAPLGTPILSGAAASGSIFLKLSVAANVGGIARGWIGP